MSRFVKAKLLTLSIFTISLVAITGCTKKAAPEKVVNLAIWANYLPADLQAQFTKATGVRIQISNYSSNEELLAKVQAGASGIDVAVPSDYMVEIMSKQDLLLPLDSAKIPNKAGLDPAFMKQEFDSENKYSLPYAWTTAGIAINRELFKAEIKGWKDLFGNKELAGKLGLLDDVREVTAAALKSHGYSVNTTKTDELKAAETTLKDVRKRVKMFTSDMIDPLVNKEIAVAQVYSADALQAARRSNGQIEYVLPVEGGTRAIDNVVILKSAKNTEEAHALINFLLSPETNVAFVKEVMGGPVVLKAKDLLPEDIKNNNSLFPASEKLAKFEGIKDLGESTQAYDRIWTELKVESNE